jgi:LmbE family N-acetylglucosaminyl deacetylase
MLGYRDSGMAGTPDNDHPASFHQAPLAQAASQLAALIQRERPAVLVTYDEAGVYGHPDHVKANRITQAAFAATAGQPWQPHRLYYTAYPHSGIVQGAQRLRAAGIRLPFETVEGQAPSFGTPDELITNQLDLSNLTDRKRWALERHASQMDPDFFLSQLSPTLFHELFARESFRLVTSFDPAPAWIDPLFGERGAA